MVGIVLVSHSAKLADGVAELAREMGGEDVRVEPAGGLDLPERPTGTDAVLVLAAIDRTWSDAGVLVLMDLGSAVLSAEMAVDMLPEERRGRVLLCEAPFVEGAVAAAVAARLGRTLEEVAEEARGGLGPKAAHLRPEGPTAETPEEPAPAPAGGPSLRVRVDNPLGLHARPAARFVTTASSFDADVRVLDLTNGRGPANARSLNAVATLGVLQGHEIEVTATGSQAQAALDAIGELAAANFGDQPEAGAPAPPTRREVRPTPAGGDVLEGVPASPGIAAGPARRLVQAEVAVPARPARPPAEEAEAFERALEAAERDIASSRTSVAARAGDQAAEIFDVHRLVLRDEDLLAPVRAAIAAGEGAAVAWDRAIREAAARWRGLETEYLRARAADLEAVGRQVRAHLLGVGATRPVPSGTGVLVAGDLTPGETAGLDPEVVLGVATAFGGPTSHAAVLARSLGLPAVVALGERVLAVADGQTVVLDGDAGTLDVRPDADALAAAEARAARLRRAEDDARRAAGQPAVTLDGVRIDVLANVGRPEDVDAAVASGAEGIGLLRTEFLFLGRAAMPDEREQADAYRRVMEALGGRPAILRTLDVGGDKPLPFLPMPSEANPFLGVRGLRLALERPQILRTQLRAALAVAVEHPVRVMFPMVTTLDEVRRARALVDEVAAEIRREGRPVPERLEVGIMVEVPAAALAADVLAPEVDFLSIGTNDLAQYTLAAERGNDRLAALADALHPAVLRLVRMTAEAGQAHGIAVGVCGELAADPVAVPFLLGLGVRELSASPAAVPRVKQAVRATDLGAAGALADRALHLASAAEVRALRSARPSHC